MIKHEKGTLMGAKFKRGYVWIALGRGPQNSVIAYKDDSHLVGQIEREKQLFLLPLPKPQEIDPSTPVRPEELQERPDGH